MGPSASEPTTIERVAQKVGRPRTAAVLLSCALSWAALDLLLRRFSLPRIDPFPYVWFQRFTLVFNLALIFVCTQARRMQLARRARREAEQIAALRALVRASGVRSTDLN